MNSIDKKYMQECLKLAANAISTVAPNPMVGCVIVCKNSIIGSGYHEKYGSAHAEVNAIDSVADKSLLKKSTLYVNLEPCSHQGKTPPCVDLIIQKKIPYVVIGTTDSNPIVKGRGIDKLVKAGIDVKVGVLDEECRELNKRFFTFHEKQRPYIILKWAQSKDGFISTNENKEKIQWISNIESQRLSHQWRSQEQAIIVGTNTALKDNPQLTTRHVKGNNPLRIVIDKSLKIPYTHHVYDNSTETIVFTEKNKTDLIKTIFTKIDFEKNILPQISSTLFKKNINSLIVEGGSMLINSFIKENLWDEIRVFSSPIVLSNGINAPVIPANVSIVQKKNIKDDLLIIYKKRELAG